MILHWWIAVIFMLAGMGLLALAVVGAIAVEDGYNKLRPNATCSKCGAFQRGTISTCKKCFENLQIKAGEKW